MSFKALTKSADDNLASASSKLTKIDQKVINTEAKHEKPNIGILSLVASENDLLTSILFPAIHVAFTEAPELAFQPDIDKYRLHEELSEKERFKAKYTEASIATTREEREKTEPIKAMAEMQLKMNTMRVDIAEYLRNSEASYQRRGTLEQDFNKEEQTTKDEHIEYLEDEIKYLR